MFKRSFHKLGTRFFAAITISVMLALNFSFAGPSPVYAANFTMTDLGTLGGRDSMAWAINEAGKVVGESNIGGDAEYHAFVWDTVGGMMDLGTLGGSWSRARALNEVGQVVGDAYIEGNAEYHAFVWDGAGGMTDLGTLGGSYSLAAAINEAGQVVGDALTAGNNHHAFVWDSASGMTDLGTLDGGYSVAVAINDAGQVVGYGSAAGNTETHAFLWDSVGGMTDLGTLGGVHSEPLAINEAGQVVGYSLTVGNTAVHAFLWDSVGGITDLGTLGGSESQAVAINESGQVVGYSRIAGNAAWHAFIWDSVGGMTDLGTLGGSDSFARAINDAGQVVGNAHTVGNAGDHSFIWDSVEGMSDLGTLGGVGSQPLAINEAGQVVGVSNMEGDFERHAFIANTSISDTTPPDTMIDSNPSNPSSSSGASFSFSGADSESGVASFECSLDSGAFTSCASPQPYSSLSDGSHTFQVRAIDGAGNIDPTPASYSWVISTVTLDVSQITSTSATCSQFNSGNAATLSQLQYAVSKGRVTAVNPSVFIYWVEVNAVAGSNSFTINQSITTGNYESHFFRQAAGSAVYRSNCTMLKGTIGTANGVTTVSFNASAPGTYIIAIKYNAASVQGFPVPSPTTVHYDFSAPGVTSSTQGLDLIKP